MSYAEFIDFLQQNLLPCGVKQLTGMDCPGCGLQTAFIALLRGDFAASIAFNPALIPLIGMFAFTAVHLRAGFRKGPQVILVLFIVSASLMIVNCIARLAHLW